MVTPSCTSPSFHQILPLCSIRLSLSAFEKSSVRRSCHWLGFSSVDFGRHQSKCSFLEGLPPLQKPACEPGYIGLPRTLRTVQASLVRFACYTQFGRSACLFGLRHVTRTRLHHLQRDWNPSAYSAFRDD